MCKKPYHFSPLLSHAVPPRTRLGPPVSILLTSADSATHQSAQAFAADFFETCFARDPRSPEAWDRYRRQILECGGSRNAMEMMTEFLGREPGPGALLQSLDSTKEDRKPLGF